MAVTMHTHADGFHDALSSRGPLARGWAYGELKVGVFIGAGGGETIDWGRGCRAARTGSLFGMLYIERGGMARLWRRRAALSTLLREGTVWQTKLSGQTLDIFRSAASWSAGFVGAVATAWSDTLIEDTGIVCTIFVVLSHPRP